MNLKSISDRIENKNKIPEICVTDENNYIYFPHASKFIKIFYIQWNI